MAMTSQATPKVERKGGGMPEWAAFRWYWTVVEGERFLTRFILLRTPLGGVDISRIHRDDTLRKYPHDHQPQLHLVQARQLQRVGVWQPVQPHVTQVPEAPPVLSTPSALHR